jgi:hypothetical protein
MKITPPPRSYGQFQAAEVACPACRNQMKLTVIEPRGSAIFGLGRETGAVVADGQAVELAGMISIDHMALPY